ncbi:MAG TPA: molecular chaperone TorD family protein [Casimicrobiaceae bacterium]|nr:molecular chaperone TorD family protein [Casimicrobiaceae bacterium]
MSDTDMTGAARADFCRLLAACFYQPDPAFAEERMFEAMATAGASLGPTFEDDARALGEAFAHEDLQALLVDYTRLFIGPAGKLASPYASSWMGRDGASPAMPVLKLYGEAGFEVADNFRDLPDHVAAELEFLYLLIFRQAEAALDGDVDALAKWEALERRFLREHLGTWVPPFAHALREGATSRFYQRLADLTERFVAAERGSVAAG